MSTQFTAMNGVHAGDLSPENASTGNGSFLSVTQQLSISFGVASSTVVLRFYNSFTSGSLLEHFHYTFSIGGIALPCGLCLPAPAPLGRGESPFAEAQRGRKADSGEARRPARPPLATPERDDGLRSLAMPRRTCRSIRN